MSNITILWKTRTTINSFLWAVFLYTLIKSLDAVIVLLNCKVSSLRTTAKAIQVVSEQVSWADKKKEKVRSITYVHEVEVDVSGEKVLCHFKEEHIKQGESHLYPGNQFDVFYFRKTREVKSVEDVVRNAKRWPLYCLISLACVVAFTFLTTLIYMTSSY